MSSKGRGMYQDRMMREYNAEGGGDNEPTKLVRVEMFESLTPRGIPNLFMALNGYYSDLRDLQNRLNELKQTNAIWENVMMRRMPAGKIYLYVALQPLTDINVIVGVVYEEDKCDLDMGSMMA